MNSPHFVTDADGKRTGVLLDLETYEQLLEAWEELDDIRAYDAAKARIDAGEEEVIPQRLSPAHGSYIEIEDNRW